MSSYWDKPCAAAGLVSYRYKGQFGWIMIGAKNHGDALVEACRSTHDHKASFANLEVFDVLSGKYEKVVIS
jgi:hypothetical protein